jgi:hypothetical protein
MQAESGWPAVEMVELFYQRMAQPPDQGRVHHCGQGPQDEGHSMGSKLPCKLAGDVAVSEVHLVILAAKIIMPRKKTGP